MKETDTSGITTETPQNIEVEYPFGYFDAQVKFAKKWSQLSGERIEQTLQTRTALYRRITNVKAPKGVEIWQAAIAGISSGQSAEDISQQLYAKYLEKPHHLYSPQSHPENDGKHFGFFAFDHYPADPATGEKDRIKVHFINKKRGEKSSLDASYLAERQADIKRMFQYIQEKHSEAEEVIGGSWLYALQSYRDSFPPQFTVDRKRLVPKEFAYIPDSVPGMSFEGDSVWGQLLDRRGGVRQHVYDELVKNIEAATTLEEMVNAFPNFPYQSRVAISVFYEWMK